MSGLDGGPSGYKLRSTETDETGQRAHGIPQGVVDVVHALDAPESRYEARRARARQEAAERRLTVSEALASSRALLAWSTSLDAERRTFSQYFVEEVEAS